MDSPWDAELDELRRREQHAEELGGPERVQRQHAGGRLTIRERITALVDEGSFHEIGKIAGRAEYDRANDLFRFTNNLVRHNVCAAGSNLCGIAGNGTSVGDATITKYFTNSVFRQNVMWSGAASPPTTRKSSSAASTAFPRTSPSTAMAASPTAHLTPAEA